jgi:hypothetical protein
MLKQIVRTDVDQSSCEEDVEDDEEVEDRLSQPVEPFVSHSKWRVIAGEHDSMTSDPAWLLTRPHYFAGFKQGGAGVLMTAFP